MKRILLLFSVQSKQHNLADPDHLIDLLQKSGQAEFEYAYFSDITFFMSRDETLFINERTSQPLESYNAIYLRHWGLPESQGNGLAIARYCKLKGISFIDQEVWRVGSQNKLTQYINLFEASVPFPRTFVADGCHIKTGIERHRFGYPFIVKAAKASRGEDNFLIETEDQLEKAIGHRPNDPFVLQQYIANDGDYRILVMGDQVKLVIRRKAVAGSHLNNTSKGGEAELIDRSMLPVALLADCIKAAAFFGRDVAGVDMVIDGKGDYYCFEVNRAPQIENSSFEAEKAALLADYLLQLARD